MAVTLDYLTLLQSAVQLAPQIKEIIDESSTNDQIVTKVTKVVGPAATILAEIGGLFFPQVAIPLRIAAAVTAAFDPSMTKWVQAGCNTLLSPSPNLKVDGIYGPATKAAVLQLQTMLGLTKDGFAGQITQAAISAALGGKK